VDWNGQIVDTRSCVPEFSDEPLPEDVGEIKARISHLVAQSVRRRLSNNAIPVCLLSGGIDSTVVAKYSKQQGVGSAITLGSFIPRRLDERYARYAAKRLEMPLQVVRARRGRMADEVKWAFDLQDEP